MKKTGGTRMVSISEETSYPVTSVIKNADGVDTYLVFWGSAVI
jgi:hypothetical protein